MKKRLLEQTFQDNAPTIDRANKVIKGLSVCGLKSANGREYSAEALKEAVANGLYNNRPSFLNHHDMPSPPAESQIGWYDNSSYDESRNRVIADLYYLETHPFTPTLLEIAERNPSKLGLSHTCYADIASTNGVDTITKIYSIDSVDVVTSPATTSGLWESTLNPGNTQTSVDPIDHVLGLVRAFLSDDSKSAQEKRSAIMGALKLVLKDEEPSATPNPEESDDEPNDGDETPKDEQTDDAPKVESLRRENRILKIIVESKIPSNLLTEDFKKAVLAVDETTAKQLIRERVALSKLVGSPTPQSNTNTGITFEQRLKDWK